MTIGIGFLAALSFVLFVAALQAVVGLPGTALAAALSATLRKWLRPATDPQIDRSDAAVRGPPAQGADLEPQLSRAERERAYVALWATGSCGLGKDAGILSVASAMRDFRGRVLRVLSETRGGRAARYMAAAAAASWVLGLVPASAAADRPEPGQWVGSESGLGISLRVVDDLGRSYVTDVVETCGENPPVAIDDNGTGINDQRFFGAEPVANPIDQRGNILPATVAFSPFRGVLPFRGRLGRESGVLRPMPQATAINDGCPQARRVRVGRISPTRPAPQPRDGIWTLTGDNGTRGLFAVFGAGGFVSDTTDPFFGTPFTDVFGTRSCGAGGTDAFATRPDGSFTLTSPPISTQGVVVDGRFLSPITAAGTFRFDIRQPPLQPGCLDGTFHFTATLSQDEPPPRGLLPEPSRAINYVAVGDSYSSGEGVEPFLAGSDTPTDRCHRSTFAYSRVVQLSPLPIARWFFACSGATTANFLTTVQYPGEKVVQLAHTTELANADLVTLTVGGNDSGFAQVLQDCVRLTGGCSKPTRRRQILAAASGLEPQLVVTYEAIKRAAPRAAIIVLGYPQLFPHNFARKAVCPKLAALYDPETQSFMRSAAELLRGTIQSATAQAGVQFIDVTAEFRGHEICGPKGDWLEGLVLTHLDQLPLAAIRNIKKINARDYVSYKSFHPTRAGQAAYARALRDYIAAKLTAGSPTTPEGLPLNPTPR